MRCRGGRTGVWQVAWHEEGWHEIADPLLLAADPGDRPAAPAAADAPGPAGRGGRAWRRRRRAPLRPTRPLATFMGQNGALRLAAVCARARAAGLAPGLMLTDARAMVPELQVHPAEPAADARLLDDLLTWCDTDQGRTGRLRRGHPRPRSSRPERRRRLPHLAVRALPRPHLDADGGFGSRSAIEGLDLGADDYLSKPFAYLELLARLRALSRREAVGSVPTVLEWGGVRLDTTRRIAERDGVPVSLTPKELGVLEALLTAQGGFVTPDELLHDVWDEPNERTRGVVKIVVHTLRRKLGQPGVITSAIGHGYRLEST